MLTSFRDLAEQAALAILVATALAAVIYVQRRAYASGATRGLVGLTSVAAGLALCFLPFTWSAETKTIGFPLPIIVFRREGGSWVDYIGQRDRLAWVVILNVILVAGMTHVIAGVGLWLRNRREKAGRRNGR